jgi:hypothetical protein
MNADRLLEFFPAVLLLAASAGVLVGLPVGGVLMLSFYLERKFPNVFRTRR